MRLNFKKIIFGVTLEKFLGYLVSVWGIKANLDKVHALVEMKPPSDLKGIQQLNGRIFVLNRIISKCTDKCLPFFILLRKNTLTF